MYSWFPLALVLYSSSSSFFTKLWKSFHGQQQSAWTIELEVSIGTLIVGFWLPSTFYLLLDTFFPSFSAAHKIQPPQSKRQPTNAQIWHCIRHAATMSVFDVVAQCLFGYWNDFQSSFSTAAQLPGVGEVALQLTFALLAYEVLSYYIHRAFHHPWLYARFHKKHHNFTAPIAFATMYTTFTEHYVSDVVPVVVPLAFLSDYVQKVHVFTFGTFLLIMYLIGTAQHSGFDFVQPAFARLHDIHHEKFNVNFGTLSFMDWIHGTAYSEKDEKRGKKIR